MAQKIQFIVAIIGNPELIILDEPFSGLDPVNLELIRDIVLELRAQGTTVIFFPPSAPMMMSLRLATGQTIPWWHAPLAVVLMVAATCAVVLLASRIYRASLLKSDSAASFRKLFQRLRAAE